MDDYPEAERWLALLMQLPLSQAHVFAAHVAASTVTHQCPCGCQSFGVTIPAGVILAPLPADGSRYCEVALGFPGDAEVDIILWLDARGYLASATVMYGLVHLHGMPDPATMTHLVGIWPMAAADAPAGLAAEAAIDAEQRTAPELAGRSVSATTSTAPSTGQEGGAGDTRRA